MKKEKARKPKSKLAETFEQKYQSALLEHLRNSSEATLGLAYEMGRSAITEGQSLLEIVSLHHRALQEIFESSTDAQYQREAVNCGASFLAESLSPFEMTHRGFQEAVQSLRRLNETLEEEIKRIAYAVHDEAGQLLVAVHLALAELAHDLPERQKQQVARLQDLLNQVERQLRRYSHELRPTILDDLGWIPAIRTLAEGVSKRTGLRVKFETSVKGRLSVTHETVLYRVVQEALNNATKHAKAKQVRIEVHQKGSTLRCAVHDDGVGFDQAELQSKRTSKGLGLVAMRERVNAIGGTFSVNSARGGGSKIFIQIPREMSDAHPHRSGR
jgi:signal transduction histidine kinase